MMTLSGHRMIQPGIVVDTRGCGPQTLDMRHRLGSKGWTVHVVDGLQEGTRAVEAQVPQVVIVDQQPGVDGWLAWLRHGVPHCAVVVVGDATATTGKEEPDAVVRTTDSPEALVAVVTAVARARGAEAQLKQHLVNPDIRQPLEAEALVAGARAHLALLEGRCPPTGSWDCVRQGCFAVAEGASDVSVCHVNGQPHPPEEWPLTRALRGQVIRDEEVVVLHPDGTKGSILVSACPLRDRQGQVLAAMGVVRDVTQVRQLQAEREDLARSRDTFTSMVAHELRTPVAALVLMEQGLLRSLRKGTLDPSRLEERLQRMDRHVQRMVELMERLLDASRLATGHLQLDVTRVDLCALVREVVERHRDLLADQDCHLQLDLPHAVVGLWDEARLELVLSNLLTNAIRHAPGQVEVCVHVDEDQARVRVVVRDHGPGIPEAELQRLFEPYSHRGTMLHAGGLGLGLWMARQLVERHGGTLGVKSQPGEGSEFTVELPLPPPVGPNP